MTGRVPIGTRSTEHDGGTHVTVAVFAGPAGGTRAFCGSLTMRPEEARELVERLTRAEAAEVD